MTKFLTGAAVAAVLLASGGAYAQSQGGAAATSNEMKAPTPAVKSPTATKGTTGAATSPGSLYDASPTNGTNLAEQPPEGETGVKANSMSSPSNPPRQPAGN